MAVKDGVLKFPASAGPDREQFLEKHEFNRPIPDLGLSIGG